MADVVMDGHSADSHSFVVRIWQEETPGESRVATWRGHITHVPGGERHYFEGVLEMVSYMLPYLRSMGVRPRWGRMVARELLRRLRRRPR